MLPRHAQAADHIGGGTRRGDPDQDIVRRGMVGRHVAPSPCGIVLGILHGTPQCTVAAGDQADDPVEGHAIGRGKLRGVRHTQPPARTGPDVKHPPAALHAFDDPLHEPFHHGDGLGHGLVDACVFAVDARQDVVYRHPL